jgi:hypothetical protein
MCWEYEDEYGECFDWLTGAAWDSEEQEFKKDSGSLREFLLRHYNIKVVNFSFFDLSVFRLLSKFHELGVIEPADPDKDEGFVITKRESAKKENEENKEMKSIATEAIFGKEPLFKEAKIAHEEKENE